MSRPTDRHFLPKFTNTIFHLKHLLMISLRTENFYPMTENLISPRSHSTKLHGMDISFPLHLRSLDIYVFISLGRMITSFTHLRIEHSLLPLRISFKMSLNCSPPCTLHYYEGVCDFVHILFYCSFLISFLSWLHHS